MTKKRETKKDKARRTVAVVAIEEDGASPAERRDAILAAYEVGLDHAEIAALVGISQRLVEDVTGP